ncbi:hypothetical protein MQE36_09055 [Zhouia spongiae]|uniref:DUF4412 domain-containing protein n=1 Tax=Zhouia spongiae TaxID=2202721 RepID=A0ABY3YH07_9FLAO|nr:hypothetical protein [Zhouia spongiae]UNY97245.1 hypothetical protein MQE36_09055 [Zhouia spongiae]
MKNIIFLLILNVAIVSCKQKQDKSTTNVIAQSSGFNIQNTNRHTTENFTEGTIDIDIYFPGNDLSDLLKKTDLSKGSIEQQMESMMASLSQEKKDRINKTMKGNPIIALQIMMAPLLKNTVFVKENMVTAKCDGLTYHLENTLNVKSSTGTVYMASQTNRSNAITLNYDEDFFGEGQFQTKIDSDAYDRQETNEIKVIAGYKCKKSIYKLKVTSPMSIEKLEVWTSEQMPKSLNFIHPYYLEEEHGIMKIDLFPVINESKDAALVYEFKTVSPGAVSDSDLSIVKTEPVYNAKTDLEQIATKLMGIMFGG